LYPYTTDCDAASLTNHALRKYKSVQFELPYVVTNNGLHAPPDTTNGTSTPPSSKFEDSDIDRSNEDELALYTNVILELNPP
jgi:hypothetical protein